MCYPTNCPDGYAPAHKMWGDGLGGSGDAVTNFDELCDCRCPYESATGTFKCQWLGGDKYNANYCYSLAPPTPKPEFIPGCWNPPNYEIKEAGVSNYNGIICDAEKNEHNIYPPGTFCKPDCIDGYVLEHHAASFGVCYW